MFPFGITCDRNYDPTLSQIISWIFCILQERASGII